VFDGKNNIVEIGANVVLHNVEFIMRYGDNNIIRIGDGTTAGGNVQIEASEGCSVELGKDCMLSHNIKIYTTDSHSICDIKGKRLNQAKNIRIGNHVWIGMNVMILKGSVVPEGCIIGANSLYCKNYGQKKSIFAGVPAKIVKEQIEWSRKLI
jgi:acetyltransferase-like isoleucine patch superfamily enzyme